MKKEKHFNGITSGQIIRELKDKYGISLSASGFYRYKKEVADFPTGTKLELTKMVNGSEKKSYTWVTYSEDEKNQIIELFKKKFNRV